MAEQVKKTIFLAGLGGGYDIFGCLPYYFKLKSSGIADVTLLNYSFTKYTVLSKHSVQLTPVLFRVGPQKKKADWLTDDVYFPEQLLANELNTIIYVILCDASKTRIDLITEAYRYLIKIYTTIDELVLIDGGSDVLLTGTEHALGTPLEDMTHARAVDFLTENEVKSKYIVVIGVNLEVGHGVLKSDIDARLTALSSDAIFTWLWQYEKDVDVRHYVEIFQRCRPHRSIVHSLISAALQGHRGYYLPEHLRSRITKSVIDLSEQTCLSIAYHFDDVVRHCVYFKRLLPQMYLNQAHNVIYTSISRNRASSEPQSQKVETVKSQDKKIPFFAQSISFSEDTKILNE